MRPTTNSLGQRIAATDKAIANFWRWFGSSCAVDALGRPLVLFHGTGASFDAFAPNERGIFLTLDPKAASNFTSIRKDAQPNVLPLYLKALRPWTLISYSLDTPCSQMLEQTPKAILARGFDTLRRIQDRVWIATMPNQLKSASGNNGFFDPDLPSLTL